VLCCAVLRGAIAERGRRGMPLRERAGEAERRCGAEGEDRRGGGWGTGAQRQWQGGGGRDGEYGDGGRAAVPDSHSHRRAQERRHTAAAELDPAPVHHCEGARGGSHAQGAHPVPEREQRR
jgi:hypothetical protein